jgi:hypothetical protein
MEPYVLLKYVYHKIIFYLQHILQYVYKKEA